MKRWMMMAASLLLCSGAVFATEKVTVEATSEDISEGLDLKAVANLFGEVKDLGEFEEKLNSSKLHLCNLDLNGDGQVDYLRVVEVEEEKDRHLVLIQAVLAKDIYQDVASIYVENNGNKNVTVQVIGDAYIYGENYVIEPVYIYRPVIYDWFWGPGWVCYSSPWYWGYWPGWYAPYPCWGYRDYWVHVHVYHCDHPRCSYRYAKSAHVQASSMRNYSSRSDYAQAHSSRNFSARTGMSNARELSSVRTATSSRGTSVATKVSSNVPTRNASGGSSGRYSGGSRGSSYTTTYTGSSRGSSSYSTTYTNSSRGSSSYGTTNTSRAASYSSSPSYSGGSRGSSSYGGGGGSSSRGSSGGSYSGGSRR